jgi:hypothetical protein
MKLLPALTRAKTPALAIESGVHNEIDTDVEIFDQLGLELDTFIDEFIGSNDAKFVTSPAEIDEARAFLIAELQTAINADTLRTVPKHTLPAGKELVMLSGAGVRRGFILRGGSEMFLGFTTAGTGTYGRVWRGTIADVVSIGRLL